MANMITGDYYSITYGTNPKVTNWIHKVSFDHDYTCIWKDQRKNHWCIGNCGFDDAFLSQCGVGEDSNACDCWIYNPSITNCPQDDMISNWIITDHMISDWMITENDKKLGDLQIQSSLIGMLKY